MTTLNEDIFKEDNSDFCFLQLEKIDQKTDWDDIVEAIYPHYTRSKVSNILLTIENMLRIYILSRHFDISPDEVKHALFERHTFREFALINFDRDVIPDASSIAEFNTFLEQNYVIMKIEKILKSFPATTKLSTMTVNS